MARSGCRSSPQVMHFLVLDSVPDIGYLKLRGPPSGSAAGGSVGQDRGGAGRGGQVTDGGPARPETERELLAMMPFAVALGIELDAASAMEVRGHLAWSPERCTAGGIMHGGVLMALADSLGGICAHLNLPPAARPATISSTTVFLRALQPGTVTAVPRRPHAA